METTLHVERLRLADGSFVPCDYSEEDYPGSEYLELEVTVLGTVEPYIPAKLTGHPDTWCPEEGGDVEVEAALLDGKPFELTDQERSQAEEALKDAAADDEPDYDDDRNDEF